MEIVNVIKVQVKGSGKRVYYSGYRDYEEIIEAVVVKSDNKLYNLIVDVDYNKSSFAFPESEIKWEILKCICDGEEVSLDKNSEILDTLSIYYKNKQDESNKNLIFKVISVKESPELFQDNELYNSFRLEYDYMSKRYVSILEFKNVYNCEYEDYDYNDYDSDIDEYGSTTVEAGDHFEFKGFRVCADIVDRKWIDIEDSERKETLKEYIEYKYLTKSKLNDYKVKYPYVEK